jgi:PAS domain S-box-containing protein
MPPAKLGARRNAGGPDRSGVIALPVHAEHGGAKRHPNATTGKVRLSELLPAAIAGMPPFCVVDLAGKLVYANAGFAALSGLLPGISGPVAPLSEAALGEIITEMEAGATSVEREFSPAPEHHVHWRAHYAGLYDSDGRLSSISGSFHDVSDLAAARHQLHVAQERLDDITRLASDWVWETDTTLALTFVSSRVSDVLGFQPLELIGRSFLDFASFTVTESETIDLPLDPLLPQPFRDLAVTMAHRDGSRRLFQVSALPVFAALTGDFLGFRGTARDVTEQAEASERAIQSQAQLTQALESISEGFALFDPDDRLVLCNSKFRMSFARVADRIVPGTHFADFIRALVDAGEIMVPDGEREAWFANRLELRKEPRASFELKLSDGRWIKVSDHRTADGSMVGIRTDITDLKTREEALFAAKEAAEIASRSKSDFLANISHELRTPLNAIIGFSEIMREELFGALGSPQYREYIGDVFDSAQHLLQLINDILDIAKAEAGKLELAEDEIAIKNVVNSAMRIVHERAHRGKIAIRTQLAADLPPLYADERKLKQILLNLLTNAVKFTPPDGTIEIAGRLAEDGDLLLTVADSGIGIAADDIAIALAPFGQVDSKLARKYDGTGLGLPLSSAMAKLHGGDMSIASVVGEGTTVTVRLPASRVRRP